MGRSGTSDGNAFYMGRCMGLPYRWRDSRVWVTHTPVPGTWEAWAFREGRDTLLSDT